MSAATAHNREGENSTKLFHYTSREAALEHILPTGRLRFGRLPRTNDPREFAAVLPGIAGFVGDDDELTTRSPFELIEDANELLRGSVHVLCFTEDRPSGVSYGRYGNGPCRARMWAQYAGNHTGVCLVFDGDRLDRAALDQFKSTPERSLIRGRVTYAPEGEYPHLTLIQPEAEPPNRPEDRTLFPPQAVPRKLVPITSEWGTSILPRRPPPSQRQLESRPCGGDGPLTSVSVRCSATATLLWCYRRSAWA